MSTADVIQLRQQVHEQLRRRVLEAIEAVREEEVAAVLGVGRHERGAQRQGYRNGATRRVVTTATGLHPLSIPRARVRDGSGTTREFKSELLPRYQRRTREVDEAILAVYLAGANSRRIKRALVSLLGDTHLSKSAISRVVSRLKALFAQWRDRDLSGERYAIVFLDGFHLKVRLAKRVVSVPVLVALGVTEDGSKRLVALELAIRESSMAWGGFVTALLDRGLQMPRLIVSDGHGGLKKARHAWPAVAVQRCTNHKWENLKKHCPGHAHGELRRDWSAIVRARDGAAARRAYDAMLTTWRTLCPPVARSLEDAGLELLTFYAFPKLLWKGLKTTNSIENLNREFRRRTKTQGACSTEEAAITLLFGLVAFRQIELRKITGHQHVAALLAENTLTDEAA